MSDRCWLEITFFTKDLEKAAQALGGGILMGDEREEDVPAPGLTRLVVYEAPYGWNEYRENFTAANIDHFGVHAHGKEYSSARFCSVDGKEYEQDCNDAHHLTAEIDWDTGRPDAEEAEMVKEFILAHEKLEEKMGIKEGVRR